MVSANAAEARDRPEPFEALFRREVGYVCGVLRRLGVREPDIEDVAQELFLRVHRKLDTFDSSRPLRPWLFGFAYRSASEYRRSPRHRALPLDGDASEAAVDVDEPGEASARRALVAEALDSLDLDRRAILVGFELDELPMKDMAATMGIPLNTAYSRLRLAREDFAKAVARIRCRGGA